MTTTAVYLSGLGLGASLIMAIGAQNAHVLRMGVRRQHVALTVAACVGIDVLLIGLGVAGAGALIESSPALLALARWGGAAFLLWYGLKSWARVRRPGGLSADMGTTTTGTTTALVTVLALSLLNPHVYLDTVVLLGSVGGRYSVEQRPVFAAGAMTASLLWFAGLGFGAARFAGVLGRPQVWRVIEALTGAVMVTLALTLVLAPG
ncbi:LysE/ArgO family amino acid transporter [[Empedobacter] haloabium]|uniref:LysE/ArgO family amino acid transporter n=1 Tax=[Empedobacter] haloabium TaxID=592317 RepID=A0ABZ1URY2_9BURK